MMSHGSATCARTSPGRAPRGALIAGAIVAFLTVGALVAFDGFPLRRR